MDREPNDELLSAYLDRELSSDELATVERWLASSASARDRLEELRATSRTIQSLPRTTLAADFADGVIERIRRESLVRPATVPTPVHRRHPAWWVGAPLAAAAALVIAVYLRGLPLRDEVRLAQNDAQPKTPATAPPPEPAEMADPAPLAGTAAPKLPDAGSVVVVHDRDHIREVEVIVIDQVEGLNAIRGICVKHGITFEDSPGDTTDRTLSRKSDLATFIAIEASDEQLDRLLADAGSASPIVEFSVTETERSLLEPRKLKVATTVRDEPRPAAPVDRPKIASSSVAQPAPTEESPRRARGTMPGAAAAGPAVDLAYRLGLMPSFAGQPPVPFVVPVPGQMPVLASTDKKLGVKDLAEASPRDAGTQGRAWVVQLLDEELAAAAKPATKPDEPRTDTLKAVEKLHRFYAEGRDVLGASPKARKPESAATRHMLLRLIEDPQAVRKEKRN